MNKLAIIFVFFIVVISSDSLEFFPGIYLSSGLGVQVLGLQAKMQTLNALIGANWLSYLID